MFQVSVNTPDDEVNAEVNELLAEALLTVINDNQDLISEVISSLIKDILNSILGSIVTPAP